MYVAYGGNPEIRCRTKDLILENIHGSSEQNASIAFDELVRDNYVDDSSDGKFYTINLAKIRAIDQIIEEESEEELDLNQPMVNALNDYRLEFAIQSNWEYSNQRAYYYYTRKEDPSYCMS